MPETSYPPRPRVRQSRSQRNDAAILQEAVRLAGSAGWAALTPGHLSTVTGLSRPTVLQRHADRPSVGAAAWREVVAEPFRAAVADLIALEGQAMSAEALHAGLQPFLEPDPVMRAASELLVVGSYVPEVMEAVEETVGADLTAWTTPARGRGGGRAGAARRSFLLAIALGYILESRRLAGLPEMQGEVAQLAAAFNHPTQPVRLPATQAAHLDAPMVFNTGEPVWDAVLQATLESVGDLGYEAATIETISAASGFTRSVIFRRYDTKYDLFTDASQRMLAPAVALNDEYQSAIAASHPMPIAEACLIRELMRPTRRRMRVITLEQLRLACGDPELQRAILDALLRPDREDLLPAELAARRARVSTELAMTTGSGLLAQLRPDAWRLPYDVVLVPWREQEATA